MNYKVGDKVRIHFPGDRYDGMTGKVEKIDPKDHRGLTFQVRLSDNDKIATHIPLWLPAKRLRLATEKTMFNLLPGDKVQNRAGLQYEIVEPPSQILFIRMIGGPDISQYLAPQDLINHGFTVVKENT